MGVIRLTFDIASEEINGRSAEEVWKDIEAEVMYIDPDFIAPMSTERCIETRSKTRTIFKDFKRHLRRGDKMWATGLAQWPQFTEFDPAHLDWFKSRLQ